MAATPDGALIINAAPTGNELVEMWRGNMRVAYPISSLQTGYPASTVSGVTPGGALICKGSPNGEEVITTWVNGNTQVAYRLRTLSGNPPSLTGRYTTPDGVTIINTTPTGNELIEAWSGNTPVAFREALVITAAILLSGPLTYNTTDAPGTLVANISGVPTGRTPTLLPADGRLVIAGDEATGWKVVKGLYTSSPGVVFITVSATGAVSATQNISIVDTNAPTFAALKAAAPQTLVVSNLASNGYGLGNDTTGNGTAATPYLTWDKACAVGVDGCFIEINPTATPYQESTAAAGYLRPNAAKAYVFAANPAYGQATIQCVGAAARVILLDATAKRRTFFGIILDGAGTSSGNIISTSGAQTGGSYFYFCNARNSTGSVYQKPTGTLNILSVVNCNIESTCHFMVSATGGNWTSQTWQGTTFSQDNQIYKGAVAGTIDTFECTGCTFTGPAGTGLGFIFGGDVIGTITLSNNTAAGAYGGPILNVSQSTAVTLWTSRLNVGNPDKGWLLCNSENVAAYDIAFNTVSTVSTQTSDPLNLRVLNGVVSFHDNTITINATAQVHAASLGGDGYNADNANSSAITAAQNLGDVSGNVYVDIPVVMAATTATVKASYIGCINIGSGAIGGIRKVGTPTGTVTLTLCADVAGVSGATIELSTTVLSAASLSTSYQLVGFQMPGHFKSTPSTKYHLNARYIGTVDGANYVQLAANTNVTNGAISTSPDGTTWTVNATRGIAYEVSTGSYGVTQMNVYNNKIYTLSGASLTTHGLMVGSTNLTSHHNNEFYGVGIGFLFKNTSGGIVYDNLAYLTSGSQAAFYFKGSFTYRCYQNTGIQASASSNLASVINSGSNSECGFNAPTSDGEIKNNIIACTGIGCPYSFDPGSVVVVDYNDVYAAPSAFAIERTTSASWATWQGTGKDVHSVLANPLIVLTPTQASDFIPPSNSPAGGIGTNLSALVPVDFNGVSFSVTPPAGAFNLAAPA